MKEPFLQFQGPPLSQTNNTSNRTSIDSKYDHIYSSSSYLGNHFLLPQ